MELPCLDLPLSLEGADDALVFPSNFMGKSVQVTELKQNNQELVTPGLLRSCPQTKNSKEYNDKGNKYLTRTCFVTKRCTLPRD